MPYPHDKGLLRALAYILASPLVLLWLLCRGIRHVVFLRSAARISTRCPACHSAVSLVGIWRCPCGYTYKGHLLTECPICFSVPKLIRCPHCQVTRKLR